jgi:serine/threonine protein kinase
MGRVLNARDTVLDREVAIKVLLPGQPAEAAAARFVSEAKITAKFPHPGIPPVHALGTLSDGGPFLAMKLIRGRTLDALLKERNTPGDDLVAFVGVFELVSRTGCGGPRPSTPR